MASAAGCLSPLGKHCGHLVTGVSELFPVVKSPAPMSILVQRTHRPAGLAVNSKACLPLPLQVSEAARKDQSSCLSSVIVRSTLSWDHVPPSLFPYQLLRPSGFSFRLFFCGLAFHPHRSRRALLSHGCSPRVSWRPPRKPD